MKKIILVAGARPNFMKVAPIMRALDEPEVDDLSRVLVHTGQHYDYEMSQAFFDDLGLPKPDHFLGVGSCSHAAQTAAIMTEFEKVVMAEKPDIVLVVGDVNSTMAASLVASKMGIGVAHVEAGLRSRDLTMPEEINRMVTDVLANWLFVSEESGAENLRAEGKPESSIHFVGNVMVDSLFHKLQSLEGASEGEETPDEPFGALTLHRPANVDGEALLEIMDAIYEIAKKIPIYFPVHPRTRPRLEATGLWKKLEKSPISLLPPLPYGKFLNLWRRASLVLTDSGGLQEETTALGIPCVTIRENTERPVTVHEGTNIIAGTKKSGILSAFDRFEKGDIPKGRAPKLWDGKASQRIVSILRS